jgi:ribosomal protein L9
LQQHVDASQQQLADQKQQLEQQIQEMQQHANASQQQLTNQKQQLEQQFRDMQQYGSASQQQTQPWSSVWHEHVCLITISKLFVPCKHVE